MGSRQKDSPSVAQGVKIEPQFPNGYPPTVSGIEWAVKQWEPLTDGGGRLMRIFHDVEIKEDFDCFRCFIYAFIDPVLAEQLAGEPDFGTREAIEKSLSYYLDNWRPIAIQFTTRVCLASPGERGPYR